MGMSFCGVGCRSGGGVYVAAGAGGLGSEAKLFPCTGGDGDAPIARRACRMARWCLDAASESCSLVSMSVSMVSSSGGGLSQLI